MDQSRRRNERIGDAEFVAEGVRFHELEELVG